MVNPIAKILGWTVIGVSLGHAAIRAYGTYKDASDLSSDIPKMWGWREMLTTEQAILLGIAACIASLLYGPTLWAKLQERTGHGVANGCGYIQPGDAFQFARLDHALTSISLHQA